MRIIDDILEISKLGTKQVKTNEKELCLNDLLLEQFSIFDIKAKENKTPLYIYKTLNNQESTIFTDSSKSAINKRCTPRKKMGRKCDLVAKSGKIEAIRFTSQKDENNYPYLEVIIAAIIWGSTGVFVKFLALPPTTITFFRLAIPTLCLFIFLMYLESLTNLN